MNFARMVDCLDLDLCEQITDVQWEYTRSNVITNTGTKAVEIRTNTSAQLVGGLEKAAHEQINAALLSWSECIKSEYPEIATCLYLPGVRLDFPTWREAIDVLKYEEGEQYKWHCDQPVEQCRAGNTSANTRCVSVVVYLNDDFEGGETEMFGRKYRPKKGKALIFPSNWNYTHRACPVIKGTKYALVTWFHPSN